MKNIIFKKRWSKSIINTFAELGFDKDNNKYLFGISSEKENDDNTEIRTKGFIKMKKKELYIRIWVLKYCFSIGTGEIELIKKSRNNFKLIIGLAGQS